MADVQPDLGKENEGCLGKARIIPVEPDLLAFTGGRVPVQESGYWAGHVIRLGGGGTGRSLWKETHLFKVTFLNGRPTIESVRRCSKDQKKRLNKRVYHLLEVHSVQTTTKDGQPCHLFTVRAGNSDCQLPSR